MANLHIWPVGKDIADVEGELLQELDELEYEAGSFPGGPAVEIIARNLLARISHLR